MAEAQLCGLQDEFTCSVCLDTLTDPVSIPCGHNFCLKCLTDYWDQSQVWSCPQCRHTFMLRPELNRNTLLNEVIKKLKKTTLSSPPPQNYAGPGDVECDFCTGKKFRAVKSCLSCPASYCQTHLQPHYEVATLKHHKLADPDRNLKEKLCEKHQKSLEIFCKTDDSCICLMCMVTGHKNHEMVELETERKEKERIMALEGNETPHILVFVDEAGFNLAKGRRRGRNIIGHRATVDVPGQRGANITMCAAISERGVATHIPSLGPYNTQKLLNFLDHLYTDLIPENERGVEGPQLPHYVIVWDNVNFHRGPRIRTWFTTHPWMLMEFLPPYSPFLNPIEEFFQLGGGGCMSIRLKTRGPCCMQWMLHVRTSQGINVGDG
ncbi:E3 ubiquitin/ISG15 ligase TRIM25-like isoform X2 [Polypterus senegalus]|uniref:E3 ubiquitin/ISG15 ligase TRIM25-like isoform X2 n=1 Tax=Polypterus senegalus TaxID=55291 RepID=UPI0019647E85|nr:E3 ubiquitin/ISG15 ligase TRIM25-like isoform X2 [Polypterus senegalus]